MGGPYPRDPQDCECGKRTIVRRSPSPGTDANKFPVLPLAGPSFVRFNPGNNEQRPHAPGTGVSHAAEWEPHAATWLTWPRPDGISFPGRYEAIPDIYARFVFHLTRHEEVHINVWSDALRGNPRNLAPASRASFAGAPASVPVLRTVVPGPRPLFVVRDRSGVRDRAIIDWGYNAWGGKYPPFDLDDQIPQHVAQFRGLPVFNPGIVMEGGSLDVNGCGTVLTTESCLLNENRNPDLNRAQIETYLRDYLNVSKVLWLGDGIVGDDTDGHIDDLTRFVSADTVVTVVEPDPADENHAPARGESPPTRTLTDQDNRPLRIIELPMPRAIVVEDQRLPASYANFYIANGIVVVPTYRDPNDAVALERSVRSSPGGKWSVLIPPTWSGVWVPSTASASRNQPDRPREVQSQDTQRLFRNGAGARKGPIAFSDPGWEDHPMAEQRTRIVVLGGDLEA